MGAGGGRDIIIAKHHVVMPGEQIMADLMRLQPAVLGLGDGAVDENSFVVGKIECAQIKFPDGFPEQGGPIENLFSAAFQLA